MSGCINLDQVRARNAHAAVKGGFAGRGVQDGDAISGFPALIMTNGLLATLAFSISKTKNDKSGYKEICNAVAEHLADPAVKLMPQDQENTLGGLRNYLESCDSSVLRLCTAETLAYLNYLRRFAKGEGKKRRDEE